MAEKKLEQLAMARHLPARKAEEERDSLLRLISPTPQIMPPIGYSSLALKYNGFYAAVIGTLLKDSLGDYVEELTDAIWNDTRKTSDDINKRLDDITLTETQPNGKHSKIASSLRYAVENSFDEVMRADFPWLNLKAVYAITLGEAISKLVPKQIEIISAKKKEFDDKKKRIKAYEALRTIRPNLGFVLRKALLELEKKNPDVSRNFGGPGLPLFDDTLLKPYFGRMKERSEKGAINSSDSNPWMFVPFEMSKFRHDSDELTKIVLNSFYRDLPSTLIDPIEKALMQELKEGKVDVQDLRKYLFGKVEILDSLRKNFNVAASLERETKPLLSGDDRERRGKLTKALDAYVKLYSDLQTAEALRQIQRKVNVGNLNEDAKLSDEGIALLLSNGGFYFEPGQKPIERGRDKIVLDLDLVGSSLGVTLSQDHAGDEVLASNRVALLDDVQARAAPYLERPKDGVTKGDVINRAGDAILLAFDTVREVVYFVHKLNHDWIDSLHTENLMNRTQLTDNLVAKIKEAEDRVGDEDVYSPTGKRKVDELRAIAKRSGVALERLKEYSRIAYNMPLRFRGGICASVSNDPSSKPALLYYGPADVLSPRINRTPRMMGNGGFDPTAKHLPYDAIVKNDKIDNLYGALLSGTDVERLKREVSHLNPVIKPMLREGRNLDVMHYREEEGEDIYLLRLTDKPILIGKPGEYKDPEHVWKVVIRPEDEQQIKDAGL